MLFTKSEKLKKPIYFFILCIIAIGIIFRVSNLEGKVYWHDEVFTGFFVTGHNPTEVRDSIFTGKLSTAQQVQSFQTYTPEKGIPAVIRNLAVYDSQHPPLYYVLSRVLLNYFHNTVFTTRLVAAIAGIALIPAMYFLALELFQSIPIAAVSAAITAVSPFHQIYAQEAREYSLWSFFIALSAWMLLVATRKRSMMAWIFYSLSLIGGLYSFIFTAIVAVGHGMYVLYISKLKDLRLVVSYGLFTIAAFIAFLPWALVISNGGIQAAGWTSQAMSPLALLRSWVGHVKSLFFNLDLNLNSRTNLLIETFAAVLIVALVSYAILWGCQRMSKEMLIFLSALGGVILLLFVGADVLLGGRRSTVSRYLIPTYISLELLVAYCIGQNLENSKAIAQRFWQSTLVVILLMGLLSNATFIKANTWSSKIPSNLNKEIADTINNTPNSLVVSSISSSDIGEIVSLSTYLDPDQAIVVFPEPENLSISDSFSRIFSFNLDQKSQKIIEDRGYSITTVYEDGKLGLVERRDR